MRSDDNIMNIVIVYLVVFAFVNCSCDGKRSAYNTVETHDGSVRGGLNYTLFHNISYYSYLGIPYAEKPINDLRFKVQLFSPSKTYRFWFRLLDRNHEFITNTLCSKFRFCVDI